MTEAASSELQYITGITEGDAKTIRAIYTSYAPRIARYVQKQGGTIQDTEDIFQDALMIIYSKAQQPGFQLTAQFYTYLFGICQRLWSNKKKKKANQVITIDLVNTYNLEAESLEQEIIANEKRKLFASCFRQLSAVCRKIMEMSADQHSIKEIMGTLGFNSENYTRVRKNRCKQKLIELIKSNAGFQEFYNK